MEETKEILQEVEKIKKEMLDEIKEIKKELKIVKRRLNELLEFILN